MVGFFCILQFLRIHKNSNFQIFSILTVSLPTFPHIFSEILSASGRKHIILHVSSRVVYAYLGTKNVHYLGVVSWLRVHPCTAVDLVRMFSLFILFE